MKISSTFNAICASILLSNIITLEDTLNVFMKTSNNINARFVRRAMAWNII
jgi:hypothetical protein